LMFALLCGVVRGQIFAFRVPPDAVLVYQSVNVRVLVRVQSW
jgi:hypothetical protein